MNSKFTYVVVAFPDQSKFIQWVESGCGMTPLKPPKYDDSDYMGYYKHPYELQKEVHFMLLPPDVQLDSKYQLMKGVSQDVFTASIAPFPIQWKKKEIKEEAE